MNTSTVPTIRICNSAQEIANAARDIFALGLVWSSGSSSAKEVIAMREEEIAAEFESLAEMLGYRVERREALEAAE